MQEKRTQYENRLVAMSRLTSLIRDKLRFPETKVRRNTKPSKTSQRKRVESKKRRGAIKKNRQSIIDIVY